MQAGALVAGVVFALTSDKGKFYISAFCGLAGVLCTFLFIPDIGGLDLREGDRRWIKNVEGKGELDVLIAMLINRATQGVMSSAVVGSRSWEAA